MSKRYNSNGVHRRSEKMHAQSGSQLVTIVGVILAACFFKWVAIGIIAILALLFLCVIFEDLWKAI